MPDVRLSRFSTKEDLKIYGPEVGTVSNLSLAQAEQYCYQLATSHYENFPVISWAVPKALRQHFANIYAYCRWSDDLGDEIESDEESLRLLKWWRGGLNSCFQNQSKHPVFIALNETVQQFSIPVTPFSDLLDAFEQDQVVNEYETFDSLLGYCQKSANPVGQLVLYLFECYNSQNVAWSNDICTGLQLANFWQDVARDHDIGRVYLPREDREKHGYGDDDLQAHSYSPAFRNLMEQEVVQARDMLRRGSPLVAHMPGRFSVMIDLFIQGGLRILQRVENLEYNVWQSRPVVTRVDKLQLMTGSLFRFVGRSIAGQRGNTRSSLPVNNSEANR